MSLVNYKINFEYNKLHLKEVVILIPKNHPNLISFLTPVLGLHGINVKEFIVEFNNRMQFLDLDIIVPVQVAISKIKTFNIFFKTPYVSSLVGLGFNKLNLLISYKFLLVKSIFNNNYTFINPTGIYKSLRIYLNKVFKNKILDFNISRTLTAIT